MAHAARTVMAAVVLLGALSTVSRARAPAVYWQTAPTLPNETHLIAGAFETDPHVELCSAGQDCRPPPDLAVWEKSVRFTLPPALKKPVSVVVCAAANTTRTASTATGTDCTTAVVNAPDVWWVQGEEPQEEARLGVDVLAGGTLRTFGRALAWEAGGEVCIPATGRASSLSSTLQFTEDVEVGAGVATCFEAAFPVPSSLPAGDYNTTLCTVWGCTPGLIVRIGARPSPPARTVLDVDKAFGGNISLALAAAAARSGATTVLLGPRTYSLSTLLLLPNHTELLGQGPETVLEFNLTVSGHGQCTALQHGTDFFFKAPYGRDIAYVHNQDSPDKCCALCVANGACNAFSWEVKEQMCILKQCLDQSHCRGGPNPDRVSAFVSPYRPEPAQSTLAAISGLEDWTIANFSLALLDAAPKTPAVLAPPGSTGFAMLNVNITMLQHNVSNAVSIDAHGFEVSGCVIHQAGTCLWGPVLGNHSDRTDFGASTTIRMHNARNGWFHHNHIAWLCSAYDVDVSNTIIFEDNVIQATEKGILPHGNSVSFYDWSNHPEARHFALNHNTQTRPPNNDRHNWAFHESFTTDGSGGWGSGNVSSIGADRRTVTAAFNLTSSSSPVTGSIVVLEGPGTGQTRQIVAWDGIRTLTVDPPFDDFLTVGESIVGVMATAGRKMVTGNAFSWGMVVQWFGTTLQGVIADNTITNNNVCSDGYACAQGDGALEGFGLCYGQAQPLLMAEYTGNTLTESLGITMHDNSNPRCFGYGGTLIRWQVMRRNTITGLNQIRSNVCGTINATNPLTTDVVSEHNAFVCPAGGHLAGGGNNVLCAHCLVRQ